MKFNWFVVCVTAILLVALGMGITNAQVSNQTGSVVVIGYDPEKPGKYLVQIDVAVDGAATVGPLSVDYSVTDPTPGPQPPDPSDLTDRAKEIRDVTLAVNDPKRAETGQTLAGVYRILAEQLRGDKINGPDQLGNAIKLTTDMILRQQGNKEAWQPVRDKMTEQFTVLVTQGASDGASADWLEEVADGLQAASPGTYAIDWDQLMKLIMFILEVLLPLIT